MRPAWIFLFFSVVYVGCAAQRAPVVPPVRQPSGTPPPAAAAAPPVSPPPGDVAPPARPDPAREASEAPREQEPAGGGVARVFVTRAATDPGDACGGMPPWTFRGTAETLTRPGPDGIRAGVAVSWSGGGTTWSFRMDPAARYPDGFPVGAADVARSWREALRRPCSPATWLLAAVAGARCYAAGECRDVSGFEVIEEDELRLLLEHAVADLPERLAHPALAITDASGASPAAFRRSPSGTTWERNPHAAAAPRLDAVEWRGRPGDDPALLLRIGEVDAALIHGRPDRAGNATDDGTVAVRLPRWDRRYALWIDPAAPALEGPAVRAGLVAAIDRGALSRIVSDGAAGIGSLVDPAQPLPSPEAPADPRSVRPRLPERLALLYDPDDPHAGRIASRLRADLLAVGTRIEPRPAAGAAYRLALGAGETALALLAHEPGSPDALLGLAETLLPLGAAATDALDAIAAASAGTDPLDADSRAAAARQAEAVLAEDHRLFPLLRIEAWLLTRPGLVGLDDERAVAGLALDRAGWLP